jgi:hypothetical protein
MNYWQWNKKTSTKTRRMKAPRAPLEDKPYADLVKIADKEFSLYIRRKYATDEGYVRCYTCGKIDHYKTMDCGHYISRSCHLYRWDEKNARTQCKYCNRFKDGEKVVFRKHLVQYMGEDAVKKMEDNAKIYGQRHIDRYTLLEYIKFYKEQNKKFDKDGRP